MRKLTRNVKKGTSFQRLLLFLSNRRRDILFYDWGDYIHWYYPLRLNKMKTHTLCPIILSIHYVVGKTQVRLHQNTNKQLALKEALRPPVSRAVRWRHSVFTLVYQAGVYTVSMLSQNSYWKWSSCLWSMMLSSWDNSIWDLSIFI